MNPWRRTVLPCALSVLCVAAERALAFLLAAREPLADLIVGRYSSGTLIAIVLGARLLFLGVLAPWLAARVVQAVLVRLVAQPEPSPRPPG